MFFIQRRLLIFAISPLDVEFLKGEVISAARLRSARPTETFHIWSPNSSRSVMKIKIMFPRNYSKHHVVYIRNTGGSISSGHGSVWAELKVIFAVKRFIHYSSSHYDSGTIESVPPSSGKPDSIRTLEPPPEKPLFPQKAPLARAVRVISELCSNPGMNSIGRHTFSMEKSNNDPLLVVHLRCQNFKCTWYRGKNVNKTRHSRWQCG
jgi:hypothetical protein